MSNRSAGSAISVSTHLYQNIGTTMFSSGSRTVCHGQPQWRLHRPTSPGLKNRLNDLPSISLFLFAEQQNLLARSLPDSFNMLPAEPSSYLPLCPGICAKNRVDAASVIALPIASTARRRPSVNADFSFSPSCWHSC